MNRQTDSVQLQGHTDAVAVGSGQDQANIAAELDISLLARAERWAASHDVGKAVKLTLLLRRSPQHDASVWEAALQQLVQRIANPLQDVSGLVARRFNQTLGFDSPIANAPAGSYDAVDEWLFSDAEALQAFVHSPAFAELMLAEHLLERSACAAAVGSVAVLYQQSRVAPRPLKIITLPRRAEHMDAAQFADYWVGVHGPLALANPPTRERLWRSEFSPRFEDVVVPGFAACQCDGVGCIWFRDEQALKDEFRDSYYAEVMAPDEPKFTDPQRSRVIPSLERVAWWRPD